MDAVLAGALYVLISLAAMSAVGGATAAALQAQGLGRITAPLAYLEGRADAFARAIVRNNNASMLAVSAFVLVAATESMPPAGAMLAGIAAWFAARALTPPA